MGAGFLRRSYILATKNGGRLDRLGCALVGENLQRGFHLPAFRLPPEAVRDGPASADADGVAGDDERGRKLSPLELVGGRLHVTCLFKSASREFVTLLVNNHDSDVAIFPVAYE